ncbi:MAG: hypothetical protein PHS74_01610 [Lachnospiraceae bacterium]|nr:hypothetical protein [Lachnospiraceae bacterium]
MEKNKRDWKQVRNAFVMVCVAVAMLSTATYAWFTLTNQPSLTGMELTAGTTSGLQISLNGSEWNSTVALPSGEKTLVPVSPAGTGAAFGKPIYAGNKVTGLETLTDDVATASYLAKYKFFLKAVGDGTVKVCLLGGTGSDATGSFVKRKEAGSSTLAAANTIRIGFKTTSDWKTFEPNTDAHNTGGKKADTTMTEAAGDFCEKTDGTFTDTSSKTSRTVFTITGGNSLEIDMYVWIEGTDQDCVDEIQTDKLIGQLQFTVAE